MLLPPLPILGGSFTLTERVPWEEIARGLAEVFEKVRRDSGVALRLDRRDRHSHANCHTFYLAYEGPLPHVRPKTVKVDITIRGCIVFPLEERVVLRGYDEYHDIPGDALIRVYSLDEIAAEKTLALLDRSRNEPRDLYDLWFLTTGRHVRLACLRDAIAGKSESRRSPWAGVGNRLEAKEARYERLWEVRLAAQMAELPPFRTVYRAVRRSLRQAGLSRT